MNPIVSLVSFPCACGAEITVGPTKAGRDGH
jgi:hypothetical protein